MKKNLKHIQKLAILSMILLVFGMLNFRLKCVGYQNNNSQNQITKSDYVGAWGDLYSQRASLGIEDVYDRLRITIGWSSSATNGTEWDFNCDYPTSTGELNCTGTRIEFYPICNGIKMNDAGEADECYSNFPQPWKDVRETAQENIQATFNIVKGNLKSALDEVDFWGDKNDILKNSKNKTLYVKNITDPESQGLKKCVFYQEEE